MKHRILKMIAVLSVTAFLSPAGVSAIDGHLRYDKNFGLNTWVPSQLVFQPDPNGKPLVFAPPPLGNWSTTGGPQPINWYNIDGEVDSGYITLELSPVSEVLPGHYGYTNMYPSSYYLSGSSSATYDREIIGSNWGYNITTGPGINQTLGPLYYSNTGTFYQYGGTNNVKNLFLGYDSGSNGTYNLNSGNLTAESEDIGLSGTGTFTQTGGTNTASWESIGGNPNKGIGTYTQTGGTNSVAQKIYIGNYYYPSLNDTYNLSGGTLTTVFFENYGTFNYSGGTLNTGVINGAHFNMSGSGTRTVNGNFSNVPRGTVKTTGTTAEFTDTFINNGGFISDTSDNYFHDLTIYQDGYLVGGAYDRFFVSNNYLNYSNQPALWDTAIAYLAFTGTGTHKFYPGDMAVGRFAWGTLD
ncbi:MAG: hypothetical protein HZA08_09635 [Nitrospirae bacterium]|nr:hypothetical protein [Nitrospirota bacterium]